MLEFLYCELVGFDEGLELGYAWGRGVFLHTHEFEVLLQLAWGDFKLLELCCGELEPFWELLVLVFETVDLFRYLFGQRLLFLICQLCGLPQFVNEPF